MEVDGTFESLTKKEVAKLNKERARLEKNLGGIKDMKDLPGAIFIIDTRKEAIAVAEAKRMGIPIIAVVDTNCDPTDIDYPVPGNDDAIRAITLFTQIIANAVVDADNEVGIEIIENLQEDEIAEVEVDAAVKEETPEEAAEATEEAPAAVEEEVKEEPAADTEAEKTEAEE